MAVWAEQETVLKVIPGQPAPQGLAPVLQSASAEDFTQQSEVADAASALLHQVLGSAGTHTRTSVGVVQLPKNASVEIDLVVAID